MDMIKTELGVIQNLTIGRMQFLYEEVASDLQTQQKAWPEFEARFPSLIGRKMFGLDYGDKKIGRASCRERV